MDTMDIVTIFVGIALVAVYYDLVKSLYRQAKVTFLVNSLKEKGWTTEEEMNEINEYFKKHKK